MYPNTEVVYYAAETDPWEYAWVGFTGSDASMILKATDFSPEKPIIRETPHGSDIHRQILHIYDARGNEFEHAVEMTGRLYTMLAMFLHGASHTTEQNSANSYVQKGIEYISSNYSYAITVEDIADYVGVSRSHLFRSFESVLGQSPKEYLTDFRMKQACYLLEHSSLSITAIANSLGFDNSLYFPKRFTNKNKCPQKNTGHIPVPPNHKTHCRSSMLLPPRQALPCKIFSSESFRSNSMPPPIILVVC